MLPNFDSIGWDQEKEAPIDQVRFNGNLKRYRGVSVAKEIVDREHWCRVDAVEPDDLQMEGLGLLIQCPFYLLVGLPIVLRGMNGQTSLLAFDCRLDHPITEQGPLVILLC